MSDFGYGQQTPWDTSSELGSICFIVRQMMAQMSTMKLVQVKAVTGGGGAIAAAGTVDVLPLVNQVDGVGNSTPHGIVQGLPWWRLQGGTGAVICDPAVNDIGYVVCADRDSSNVISTKAQANPGSFRKYDLADGVYVGGLVNGVPTQYLAFSLAGFALVDANGDQIVGTNAGIAITPESGQQATVNGPMTVTGALTADSIATVDGNQTIQGTLHVEETLQVDGAADVLSLQIASGAKITRLLTGSLTATSSIPAGGVTLIAFEPITGVQTGDLVLLSNWEIGATCVLQPVTASGGVNFYVANPTASTQAISISTNILVIGTT